MMQGFLTFLSTTTPADACNKAGDFFGLIPWYHYLTLDPSTCDVQSFNILPSSGAPSDIPLILLAIINDLLRIAGLAALAFVFYGAIRYTTSQGNPDSTSKAQSTIINSLVGLAIAIAAVGIVSFIGNQLGQNASPSPVAHAIQPGNLPNVSTGTQTLKTIIGIVFGIIGALSLLMITISGLRYVLSAGDPQKASTAKNGIVFALVGLIIALTAESLVAFVIGRT
jgi:hypothetical protein